MIVSSSTIQVVWLRYKILHSSIKSFNMIRPNYHTHATYLPTVPQHTTSIQHNTIQYSTIQYNVIQYQYNIIFVSYHIISYQYHIHTCHIYTISYSTTSSVTYTIHPTIPYPLHSISMVYHVQAITIPYLHHITVFMT